MFIESAYKDTGVEKKENGYSCKTFTKYVIKNKAWF